MRLFAFWYFLSLIVGIGRVGFRGVVRVFRDYLEVYLVVLRGRRVRSGDVEVGGWWYG